MSRTRTIALATAIVLALGGLGLARAQHAGHGGGPATPAPAAKPPKPITMKELHRSGGVPPGWKFRIPQGDPKVGREIFAKLECSKCHEVKPDFPRSGGAGDVGPELTGMGAHHPAEYFAQSIVDPNAVILAGPGWVGPDGRSTMPDFRDSLTLTELVDLVAYIKSLDGRSAGGGGAPAHHQQAPPEPTREQEAGPYRVRVEFRSGNDPDHSHRGHHAAGALGGALKRVGHLMVFVADSSSGEPVPYLPVSAVITAGKAPPRTVPLAPMVSGSGFHYGADVVLPAGMTKITFNLGVATLRTMGGMAERYAKPVTVSFDWSD